MRRAVLVLSAGAGISLAYGILNSKGRDSDNTNLTNRKAVDTNISQIILLGERNSGTNYIQRVLKKAFYPQYAACNHTKAPFAGRYNPPPLLEIPILKHKHMLRHTLLNEKELEEVRRRNDALWILVVRHPCHWVDGMWRKPWFMCSPSDPRRCPSDNANGALLKQNVQVVANLSRADFLQVPWVDAAESRLAPEDPTQFTYPNVLALRRHKLRIMHQIIDSVVSSERQIVLAHLQQVERNPEGFVQEIATTRNLSVNADYKPQRPSKKQSHPIQCWTQEELKILGGQGSDDTSSKNHNRFIDWDLEAQFGFHPSGCELCDEVDTPQ